MGVEHQMARMTPHGPQITGEGFGGSGGTLSQTDIAMGLAGLKGKTYWFMRLKFCGDTSMLKPLKDGIAFQMLGEAMLDGPDVSAKGAQSMALVAILQATTGPICEACNGTGILNNGITAKDCKPCKGSGKLQMTQSRAAKLIGVSVPTYVKQYKEMVETYVSRLEGYESHGLAHVRRRIYGGDDSQ